MELYFQQFLSSAVNWSEREAACPCYVAIGNWASGKSCVDPTGSPDGSEKRSTSGLCRERKILCRTTDKLFTTSTKMSRYLSN